MQTRAAPPMLGGCVPATLADSAHQRMPTQIRDDSGPMCSRIFRQCRKADGAHCLPLSSRSAIGLVLLQARQSSNRSSDQSTLCCIVVYEVKPEPSRRSSGHVSTASKGTTASIWKLSYLRLSKQLRAAQCLQTLWWTSVTAVLSHLS